jgi:hypothetical protein
MTTRIVTDSNGRKHITNEPQLHKPRRQWVGLTMEDKQEYLAQDFGGSRADAMDWADKRLKEKNT